jgi:hypothetical protein
VCVRLPASSQPSPSDHPTIRDLLLENTTKNTKKIFILLCLKTPKTNLLKNNEQHNSQILSGQVSNVLSSYDLCSFDCTETVGGDMYWFLLQQRLAGRSEGLHFSSTARAKYRTDSISGIDGSFHSCIESHSHQSAKILFPMTAMEQLQMLQPMIQIYRKHQTLQGGYHHRQH